MKPLFISILTLLIFWPCRVCGADLPAKVAVNTFLNTVKAGDSAVATSLVYQPQGSEQRIQVRVRSIAQRAKVAGVIPEFVDAREYDSIAMVIVKDTAKTKEGKADYDALFLIKRDGKWLLVLGIAEVEDRRDILTNDERENLKMLRDWQDIRMRELNLQPVEKK